MVLPTGPAWTKRDAVEALSIVSGQRILKNADFAAISYPTKGRIIYELDVPAATHIKMLQEYREALSEWKAAKVLEESRATTQE